MKMDGACGLTAAACAGERELALVWLLLTTFLIGCRIGFDTIGDGNFVSLFDGRGRVACAEMADGAFGDERIAGNKGERVDSSICSLLMTILSVGRFVDEFAST